MIYEELIRFLQEQTTKENRTKLFSDWKKLEDRQYCSDKITILAAEALRLQIEKDNGRASESNFTTAVILVEILALYVIIADANRWATQNSFIMYRQPTNIKEKLRYIIVESSWTISHPTTDLLCTVIEIIIELGFDPLKIARTKFLREY